MDERPELRQGDYARAAQIRAGKTHPSQGSTRRRDKPIATRGSQHSELRAKLEEMKWEHLVGQCLWTLPACNERCDNISIISLRARQFNEILILTPVDSHRLIKGVTPSESWLKAWPGCQNNCFPSDMSSGLTEVSFQSDLRAIEGQFLPDKAF